MRSTMILATLILPLSTLNAETLPADLKLLTPACEEALAVSALPANLREQASAYTLTREGYKLTRERDGGFVCIVGRNHSTALIPQCPNSAGADEIIPGIILKSEWTLSGIEAEERATRFQALINQGTIKEPKRPGISYMMSNFNYAWNSRALDLMRIPPHVMMYAPDVSNEEIGGSMRVGMSDNRGYPFIVEEGIHGYITTLVEHTSDSGDVLAACNGQLPAVAGSGANGD